MRLLREGVSAGDRRGKQSAPNVDAASQTSRFKKEQSPLTGWTVTQVYLAAGFLACGVWGSLTSPPL